MKTPSAGGVLEARLCVLCSQSLFSIRQILPNLLDRGGSEAIFMVNAVRGVLAGWILGIWVE